MATAATAFSSSSPSALLANLRASLAAASSHAAAPLAAQRHLSEFTEAELRSAVAEEAASAEALFHRYLDVVLFVRTGLRDALHRLFTLYVSALRDLSEWTVLFVWLRLCRLSPLCISPSLLLLLLLLALSCSRT